MALSPWPAVLCKPLALWLSAFNYTVIWHRAPESPLGPLLHACSLIKAQGLVSADNPVRLALICWADDPGISSPSSDWFQGKAKQNTGQSVSVYSGVLGHDYLFQQINLMLLAMWHLILKSFHLSSGLLFVNIKWEFEMFCVGVNQQVVGTSCYWR